MGFTSKKEFDQAVDTTVEVLKETYVNNIILSLIHI